MVGWDDSYFGIGYLTHSRTTNQKSLVFWWFIQVNFEPLQMYRRLGLWTGGWKAVSILGTMILILNGSWTHPGCPQSWPFDLTWRFQTPFEHNQKPLNTLWAELCHMTGSRKQTLDFVRWRKPRIGFTLSSGCICKKVSLWRMDPVCIVTPKKIAKKNVNQTKTTLCLQFSWNTSFGG